MRVTNRGDILQSSYKQYHSTETVLLKVQTDILTTLDQHGAVLMLLLDFSCAFDTVDHTRLLSILQEHIGISGSPSNGTYPTYLDARRQYRYWDPPHPGNQSTPVYLKVRSLAQSSSPFIHSDLVKLFANMALSIIFMQMTHNST